MAGKNRVSLKQLAKMANLSTATISRVLNNSGRFSEHTRDVVMSLVNETGYTPNVAARALRTRTARAVGVVVPDLLNEFFLMLVNAVEKSLFQNDYSLFVCNAGEDKHKNSSLISNLVGKGVDGLIYISRFPLAHEMHIPTVCLDRASDHENIHAMVSSDNVQGGRLAAGILADAGSRQPVVVCDQADYTNLSTVQDRISGFSEVLSGRGIPWTPKDAVFSPPSISEVRKRVKRAILSGLQFDGVFATSDNFAFGAILGLKDVGLHVPKDVNVVGYDDVSFSGYFTPPLTTIRQDTTRLGVTGAKTLLSMMENGSSVRQHIEIPVQLIVRSSTRRAVQRDG